jgi:hypothetical protein
MKKILFLLIFSLTATFSFSQTWFPNGTTWHYNYRNHNNGTFTETYLKFEAVRDTVINSKTCKVIYQTRVYPQYSRGMTSYFTYEQNGVVYRLNPMTNAFNPYYDINAAVGASWTIFRADYPFENLTIQVLSKGTTIINGQTLKKINVNIQYQSFSYQDEIIERIGFRSMFTTVMPYMIDPLCRGLRCFEDSFVGNYSFNITPTCTYQAIPTGIEKEFKSGDFKIYPNPFKNELQIEGSFANVADENLSFQILDNTGKEILKFAEADRHHFNTSSLPSGLYFLLIKDQHKVLTRKKIIKL